MCQHSSVPTVVLAQCASSCPHSGRMINRFSPCLLRRQNSCPRRVAVRAPRHCGRLPALCGLRGRLTLQSMQCLLRRIRTRSIRHGWRAHGQRRCGAECRCRWWWRRRRERRDSVDELLKRLGRVRRCIDRAATIWLHGSGRLAHGNGSRPYGSGESATRGPGGSSRGGPAERMAQPIEVIVAEVSSRWDVGVRHGSVRHGLCAVSRGQWEARCARRRTWTVCRRDWQVR